MGKDKSFERATAIVDDVGKRMMFALRDIARSEKFDGVMHKLIDIQHDENALLNMSDDPLGKEVEIGILHHQKNIDMDIYIVSKTNPEARTLITMYEGAKMATAVFDRGKNGSERATIDLDSGRIVWNFSSSSKEKMMNSLPLGEETSYQR